MKRLLACALAIPLAGVALSGCGDDGGNDNPDAGRPDATPAPPDAADMEPTPDAGVDYDLTIKGIGGGRLETYPGYQNIVGAVQLVRMAEALRAELYVEGLAADTEYVAHVHRLPCEENQAGGHYKHDPTIEAEVEANEIWLRFTTDADGRGSASTEQLGKAARMDAQAIVIHDPNADGAKMACANLFFDDAADADIELQGAFTAFPDAPAADQGFSGSVTVTLSPDQDETFINFDLEGLDPAATYVAFVHELPCEVAGGGGHYKRDTTIVDEDENNEIWPDPAMQEQTFDHALRYDAQSIIVYRMEENTPRVACANLGRATEIPEYATTGEGGTPPGGGMYAGIDATVTMTRKKDGTTETTLTAIDLPEDTTGFGAYVHAGTCDLDPPGGARYQLDPDMTAEAEANEIWLSFDADAQGEATITTPKGAHVARPEAISVVIFEPATDNRLACIELQ